MLSKREAEKHQRYLSRIFKDDQRCARQRVLECILGSVSESAY